MKLLIRTVTIATIGLFMFLIILNSTIVETIKQELQVATNAAMNRCVDAYIKNQALIESGEENLYFETDQEFYNFFYDSLAVQMNGKFTMTIYCNEVDVETGLLDIDATVNYKGIDGLERTYTVHSESTGKIPEMTHVSEYKQNLLKELSLLKANDIVIWADYRWVVVSNDTDGMVLLLEGNLGQSAYDVVEYKYSSIRTVNEGLFNSLDEKYQAMIGEYTLDNMNTLSGIYLEGGADTYVSKVFPISLNELKSLQNAGYEAESNFWLRTVAENQKVYIAKGNSFDKSNKVSSNSVKPAVKLLKSKIGILNYDEDAKIYTIE